VLELCGAGAEARRQAAVHHGRVDKIAPPFLERIAAHGLVAAGDDLDLLSADSAKRRLDREPIANAADRELSFRAEAHGFFSGDDPGKDDVVAEPLTRADHRARAGVGDRGRGEGGDEDECEASEHREAAHGG
jgi:hypothetical protein